MKPNDFQLIIIDNPYDVIADPFVAKMFPQIMELKIKGYRSHYQYGVLPLDTVDFFGTHFIFAQKELNELKPVMAFKAVTRKRCEIFHSEFPALALMRSTGNKKHELAVREILDNSKKNNSDVSYFGSFTIIPELRKNRELVDFILRIFMMTHINFSREFDIPESIVGVTVKFKLQRYFYQLGYKHLFHEGEDLPPIQVPVIENETSKFHYLNHFSELAVKKSKELNYIWNQKIFIAEGIKEKGKIAA